MKTLILLLSALSSPSFAQKPTIPAKPVNTPVNCDSIATFDAMIPTASNQNIDLILVSKTKRKIYFISQDKVAYAFTTAFGGNIGNKIQEGDNRTPEGTYQVSVKNSTSQFHKSLGVSYPNASDVAYAKKYNVQVGGDVMIHGMKNTVPLVGYETVANAVNMTDWTQGCMAVRNDQIDTVFPLVKVGTKIEVCPRVVTQRR